MMSFSIGDITSNTLGAMLNGRVLTDCFRVGNVAVNRNCVQTVYYCLLLCNENQKPRVELRKTWNKEDLNFLW